MDAAQASGLPPNVLPWSPGVKPDAVSWLAIATPNRDTTAKGLAGGVPIGVAIANQDTASGFTPGDHGSTFGGNPLACAASIAVLNTLEEGHLIQKAAGLGDHFREALEDLGRATGMIREVRGAGLMLGVEFNQPIAAEIKGKCLDHGYLVGSVGTHVLRLLPPLIIEKPMIDEFVAVLAAILEEVKSA